MADTYKNFRELAEHETQDVDFSIRGSNRNGVMVIIAPHGGGIEPGTSALAEAIAGTDFSFYAFAGLKRSGNSVLHITSTRFDEPQALELIAKSRTAIAIHGEDSDEPIVFLGGRDTEMLARFRGSLEQSGFRVETHRNPDLQGTSRDNICNRANSGRGVQLELSKGLRETFFLSLSKTGRQTRTDEFAKFVAAVRTAIDAEAEKVRGVKKE